MTYKEFFTRKKIAVIGLGPHGEMIPDIKFLLKNKAYVEVYDMRSEKRLKPFISELKDAGLERYNLGDINPDVLLNFDLIILSPEISKKSLFLKKVIQEEIPVEFPDTLFFKLSPPVTLIGVLGAYGKSVIAKAIYDVLKKAFSEYEDQGLFLIDHESFGGALHHLKRIKKGDVIIVKIPEHFIPHYRYINISPHVAVVTSIIDFSILSAQTYNNFIVAPDEVIDAIGKEKNFSSKAKMLRTRGNSIPEDWNISPKSFHEKENLALILQASELFKASPQLVREVAQNSTGPRGSLELVKKVGGIEFYNDANAVHPRSTLSALRSLGQSKNIVLILGGAYTGHDYREVIQNIPQYASTVILLPGSGTLGIRPLIDKLEDIVVIQALSLEEAVKEAHRHAKKGQRVLFSPAFDAVGIDTSRKERGEKFVKAVRGL